MRRYFALILAAMAIAGAVLSLPAHASLHYRCPFVSLNDSRTGVLTTAAVLKPGTALLLAGNAGHVFTVASVTEVPGGIDRISLVPGLPVSYLGGVAGFSELISPACHP